jgi:hypothetical protein
VGDVKQVRASIDAGALEKEITLVSTVDWRQEWEDAQHDTTKRAELAEKIKELRKFETLAEPANKLIKAITAITGDSSLNTLLTRMVSQEYGALRRAIINVVKAIPKVQTIYELGRAMHSHNILIHLQEMFARNDWLDVVLLQEVNDPALLAPDKSASLSGAQKTGEEKGLYETYYGPHLISGGTNPQQEYYPLLIKKSSGLKVQKIYQVGTDGTMVAASSEIHWDKSKGVFRPIIVYEITRANQITPFWLGVVHTTPEPDSSGLVAEFNRENIYQEITKGLQQLSLQAKKHGIPLIIGGDYYLTAEAVVTGKNTAYEAGSDPDIDRMKVQITALRDALVKDLGALEKAENLREADQRKMAYMHERIKFLTEALRDEQLCRNLYDLTVRNQVEDLGLLIAQTVSGTNPKHDPLTRWFDLQIADFFIHNQAWPSGVVGLLRPEGKIVQVDTKDLTYSRYWQHFSDHFPVAAIFSLKAEDLQQHEALVTTSASQDEVDKINVLRYAGYSLKEKRLAWLQQVLQQDFNPFNLPQWCYAIVHIARFLLGQLDKQSSYDFSIPANVWDCWQRIQFFEQRLSEVLATQELKSLEPEQIQQLALDYLGKKYRQLLDQAFLWGEGMEDIDDRQPDTLQAYTQKIQELENLLSLRKGERLLVTTPQDFQPDYFTQSLVEKLKAYIGPPKKTNGNLSIVTTNLGIRTVHIDNAIWYVNNTLGAGNCFYHAIYEALHSQKSTVETQQVVRNTVVNAMLTNQQIQTHLFGAVPDLPALNRVINQIIQPGNWTENFTPSFVAESLNLEIVVMHSNGSAYYTAGPTQADGNTRRIYLCYNGAHYESITRQTL